MTSLILPPEQEDPHLYTKLPNKPRKDPIKDGRSATKVKSEAEVTFKTKQLRFFFYCQVIQSVLRMLMNGR